MVVPGRIPFLAGLGNDTFVVDNAGDQVSENASEGTDLVQSSVAFSLAVNLENLTLTGSSAINGTGNASWQRPDRQHRYQYADRWRWKRHAEWRH